MWTTLTGTLLESSGSSSAVCNPVLLGPPLSRQQTGLSVGWIHNFLSATTRRRLGWLCVALSTVSSLLSRRGLSSGLSSPCHHINPLAIIPSTPHSPIDPYALALSPHPPGMVLPHHPIVPSPHCVIAPLSCHSVSQSPQRPTVSDPHHPAVPFPVDPPSSCLIIKSPHHPCPGAPSLQCPIIPSFVAPVSHYLSPHAPTSLGSHFPPCI